MNTKMYVGNLSYDATDSDIRELFEAHGTVSDVFIVKDRESDRPRGFAFVSMETPEEMNAAIEGLNGAEFAGRALTINEARPREERHRVAVVAVTTAAAVVVVIVVAWW
jgi:RNA recognition motif-containing protein